MTIPYGAGFDEENHLLRIYDLANLHWLPNRSAEGGGATTPKEIHSLSYQRRFYQTSALDLFRPENFQRTIRWDDLTNSTTRSIYPPSAFLPQALLVRVLWLEYNLPFIPVTIVCRVAGLLLYLLGAYWAIRLMPVGKWLLFTLALSPMTLYQASTLNADGFTNTLSFLWFAWILKLHGSQEHIRKSQVWGLTGLALMIGLAKPAAFLVLPLLLILPLRCFPSKKLVALLLAGALLAVILSVGWSRLAIPGSHFDEGGAMSLGRQRDIVLSNLGDFVHSFIVGNLASAGKYWRDWVGVYGHWVGAVPQALYWLYSLALLAAFLIEPQARWFTWRARLFILAVFGVAAAITILLYYYAAYTPGDLSILGKHGRYFSPLAPLLFVSLVGWLPWGTKLENYSRLLTLAVPGLLAISLAIYSFGLYATYYSQCATTIYTGKPCVLPVLKNFDLATSPVVHVDRDTVVQQEIFNMCLRFETLGALFKIAVPGAKETEWVAVLVKDMPKEASGALRFSVLDQAGQVLAAQDFPLTNLSEGQYVSLPVRLPSNVNDNLYELRLESKDISPSAPLSLAISPQDYYDGHLKVNGEDLDADLIFRYQCVNPWPSIP